MKSDLDVELRHIEVLAKSDDYAEALRRLDDLAAVFPKETKVWATRAYINERKGDSGAAIADWSKLINLSNKEPHPFYVRGILFIRVARYREAVADFTKVIELGDFYNSDYYREPAYFCRADAYSRLGEFEKARLDCIHVRDDMQTWTDRLRTKAGVLADCS